MFFLSPCFLSHLSHPATFYTCRHTLSHLCAHLCRTCVHTLPQLVTPGTTQGGLPLNPGPCPLQVDFQLSLNPGPSPPARPTHLQVDFQLSHKSAEDDVHPEQVDVDDFRTNFKVGLLHYPPHHATGTRQTLTWQTANPHLADRGA